MKLRQVQRRDADGGPTIIDGQPVWKTGYLNEGTEPDHWRIGGTLFPLPGDPL